MVFAPATGRLHGGVVGQGAWRRRGRGRRTIRTRARGSEITAVASKSHLNQATIDYLEAAVGACGYVSVGSSLKFCIVAEGKADIYPRAAPTSEWDTAAGHAVLLAAGGLVDGPDGAPLRYGKRAFLNRAFVATSGWKRAGSSLSSSRFPAAAIFRREFKRFFPATPDPTAGVCSILDQ